MHLEKYQYSVSRSFLDYEFISDGPKGKIKKIVRFTQLENNIYNLAFGDLIDNTRDINDMNVTNNSDRNKVLHTVAAVVIDFTIYYPNAIIVVQGSTKSRTRLYRMGINKYLAEIQIDFEILGLMNNQWRTFTSHLVYDAFLIRRK